MRRKTKKKLRRKRENTNNYMLDRKSNAELGTLLGSHTDDL